MDARAPVPVYRITSLGKGIQTPVVQSRSTKVISVMKWIQTSKFVNTEASLFTGGGAAAVAR